MVLLLRTALAAPTHECLNGGGLHTCSMAARPPWGGGFATAVGCNSAKSLCNLAGCRYHEEHPVIQVGLAGERTLMLVSE